MSKQKKTGKKDEATNTTRKTTEKYGVIPRDEFNTEAAQIPDARDVKTSAAIPSDENVERARHYVEENRK